jgi:hypothetical protein
VTVGGLALNSVNFCIATTGPIGTDRGIDQRQLRAGWAVHLPSVTLAVEVVTFISEVINGLSNAATFSYGCCRSGVLNCLHR